MVPVNLYPTVSEEGVKPMHTEELRFFLNNARRKGRIEHLLPAGQIGEFQPQNTCVIITSRKLFGHQRKGGWKCEGDAFYHPLIKYLFHNAEARLSRQCSHAANEF